MSAKKSASVFSCVEIEWGGEEWDSSWWLGTIIDGSPHIRRGRGFLLFVLWRQWPSCCPGGAALHCWDLWWERVVHLHEDTLGVNHCSVSMLLVLIKFSFGSLFDHQHHVWIQIQIIELRLIILSFDVNLKISERTYGAVNSKLILQHNNPLNSHDMRYWSLLGNIVLSAKFHHWGWSVVPLHVDVKAVDMKIYIIVY